MPLFAIPFPMIDPIAISLGPLDVRWYALAYIAGLLLGWVLARELTRRDHLWAGNRPPAQGEELDDLLVHMAIGIIVGGRLGYVLFYNLPFYLDNPLDIPKVWHGGMSFHGGMLGAIVAMAVFAWRRERSLLPVIDLVAAVAPIGLFFGRIANFVNGELWGRVTDVPWGVIFPEGGPAPRHPSQLYQATLEGLVLFALVMLAVRLGGLKRPGTVGGTFLAGYGMARIVGEFFREPDRQLGFLAGGLTMGMALSIPMVIVGLLVVAAARRRAEPA